VLSLQEDYLIRCNNDQAMKQAGLSDPSKCYVVDDSCGHVDAAHAIGWAKCVHFFERENLGGEIFHTKGKWCRRDRDP